jgi:hypothetical protein
MDDPAGLTLPTRFRARLSGLPTELADELEDHLVEACRAAREKGCPPAEAERLAWEALGDVESVREQWLAASGRNRWRRHARRVQERFKPTAWMSVGVYLMSRICMALEPDRFSIAGSIAFGAGFVLLGMAVHRSWRWSAPVEWAGLLVLASLGLGSLAAPAVSIWLEQSVALDPGRAGILALLAGLACLVSPVSRAPASA